MLFFRLEGREVLIKFFYTNIFVVLFINLSSVYGCFEGKIYLYEYLMKV